MHAQAMLYDSAHIFVQGGRGGNGCVSFRREAHVPRGGPDGGDGGWGGSVVVVCDDSLRDLQAFRRRTHFRAARGRHGEGALRHGARGEDLEVRLPPGTQVSGPDGTVHDLVRPGQRALVARGGAGGRGNKHFATATRQAPRFAERGLPGQEAWLDVRLKLLADAGLVGLPNAGKSSLLRRLTRAAPKVAPYPFTTVEPVLGTLEREGRQLVLADIPGLIEGASAGAGLGHEFLAHLERTRLLVHALDLAPVDGSDPESAHAVVERELEQRDPRLATLPRVLALTKADLLPAEEGDRIAARWRDRLGAEVPVIVTSSATGQGIAELAAVLQRRLAPEPDTADAPPVPADAPPVPPGSPAAPTAPAAPEPAVDLDGLPAHRVFRPRSGRGFEVRRTGPHAFRVDGERVERLLARFDLDNDEALAHIESRLRRIGVLSALEDEGFEPGDDVEIAGVVFELDPGR